jgi:hypothetical protein
MSELQKNAAKLLPWVKLAAEGVELQQLCYDDSWVDKRGNNWSPEDELRVKPKIIRKPFGREQWEAIPRVRYANGATGSYLVEFIGTDCIEVNDIGYSFEEAAEKFVQVNGDPCYVEVEDA